MPEPTNKGPPFQDVNLWESDAPLREAVAREGAEAAADLSPHGAESGSAESFETGRLANENPPRLRRYDARGVRIDRVEFHPAWHEAMRRSVAAGLHASCWDHLARPGTKQRHVRARRRADSQLRPAGRRLTAASSPRRAGRGATRPETEAACP